MAKVNVDMNEDTKLKLIFQIGAFVLWYSIMAELGRREESIIQYLQ
jgi:hypothetical protein